MKERKILTLDPCRDASHLCPLSLCFTTFMDPLKSFLAMPQHACLDIHLDGNLNVLLQVCFKSFLDPIVCLAVSFTLFNSNCFLIPDLMWKAMLTLVKFLNLPKPQYEIYAWNVRLIMDIGHSWYFQIPFLCCRKFCEWNFRQLLKHVEKHGPWHFTTGIK